MPVKGKGSKDKGARFERELADHFSSSLGLKVSRMCLSTQFIQNPGVGAPDLIGLPNLAVEAKRTETLKPHVFMAQAVRNASHNEIPTVITRRSRQTLDDSFVILRLSDFTALYKKTLILDDLI